MPKYWVTVERIQRVEVPITADSPEAAMQNAMGSPALDEAEFETARDSYEATNVAEAGPTPDRLLQTFKDATNGIADISVMDAFWDILDDVLGSVKLACEQYDLRSAAHIDSPPIPSKDYVFETVRDYVGNNYGD